VKRALALILAALMLVAPAGALGLSVTEVAQELRCVTCGTPLDVSNAPAAQRMKARIAVRIDQGATKQQILDEFVRDFGRQVLATPPKHGFDLIAWLLPAIAVVAGLCAIPFVTRAWSKRRADADPDAAPPQLSAEDQARVDHELEALGEG
jgi:cytochrome c-type biogenesis protein CcmH